MSFHSDDIPEKSNVVVLPNVYPRQVCVSVYQDKEFARQVRGQAALKMVITDCHGTLIRLEKKHIEALPTERQRAEFREARRCGRKCGRVVWGPVLSNTKQVAWRYRRCYCSRGDAPQPEVRTLRAVEKRMASTPMPSPAVSHAESNACRPKANEDVAVKPRNVVAMRRNACDDSNSSTRKRSTYPATVYGGGSTAEAATTSSVSQSPKPKLRRRRATRASGEAAENGSPSKQTNSTKRMSHRSRAPVTERDVQKLAIQLIGELRQKWAEDRFLELTGMDQLIYASGIIGATLHTSDPNAIPSPGWRVRAERMQLLLSQLIAEQSRA